MSSLYTVASNPPAAMLADGLKDMPFRCGSDTQRQHIVGVDNAITDGRK
ncbi:hypothetical protein [Avibacterium avium]